MDEREIVRVAGGTWTMFPSPSRSILMMRRDPAECAHVRDAMLAAAAALANAENAAVKISFTVLGKRATAKAWQKHAASFRDEPSVDSPDSLGVPR